MTGRDGEWVGGWNATKRRVDLGQVIGDNLILQSMKPVKKDKGRVQEASALSHLSWCWYWLASLFKKKKKCPKYPHWLKISRIFGRGSQDLNWATHHPHYMSLTFSQLWRASLQVPEHTNLIPSQGHCTHCHSGTFFPQLLSRLASAYHLFFSSTVRPTGVEQSRLRNCGTSQEEDVRKDF